MEPGSRGRCEVAVQWEPPEGQEVGVQSQTLRSDVAVQVDLIGLSYNKPGSCDVPWRCVSVRAEPPGGGALWTCCLHSPSVLLCPLVSDCTTLTLNKAPGQNQQTTLPSMHHSSPSDTQCSPRMPFCGDSPSSPKTNTTDPPDPPHDPPDAPDPLEPSPKAAGPSEPTPEAPDPTEPTPTAPDPTEPTLEAPDPTEPTPEAPDPSEPTLEAPDPTEPTPEAPDPTEPILEAPDPTEPTLEAPDPSEPTPKAPDPTEHSPEAPDPSEPTPEAALEALGLMAPLSSDEDCVALSEHDEQISKADPPIKRRRPRSRPRQRVPPPPPRESSLPRRNRQAGLPLRYQLDYDLELSDGAAADQELENGEGAGPGGDQDENVLYLPYYRRSLDLGEFEEFQNTARRQFEALHNQEECDSLERLMPRPLSPGSKLNKPRLLPLKLKKVKNKVVTDAEGSRKTRNWLIDGTAIKEERISEERSDLESSDWSKHQKIKEEHNKVASRKTWLPSKRKRFEVKEEDDWVMPGKDKIWRKQLGKSKCVKTNAVKMESGRGSLLDKRKVGRPRRVMEVKQEEEIQFEIQTELEEFESETSSAEQSMDRPRRSSSGPPLRYLLESELETEIKTEEVDEDWRYGAGFANGTVESSEDGLETPVSRKGRLKLGDMHSSAEGKGDLVKKVKILNSETNGDGRDRGFEDVRDLFMLQGEEERRDRHNQTRGRGGGRRRRGAAGGGGGGRGRGAQADSKRQPEFLVYRDQETGRAEFISPCYVKLQTLKE